MDQIREDNFYLQGLEILQRFKLDTTSPQFTKTVKEALRKDLNKFNWIRRKDEVLDRFLQLPAN